MRNISILHKCEGERLALDALHRIQHRSWPEIARLPRYWQIPMTSLYMWAVGRRDLANVHKIKLGIPVKVLTVPCSACGDVHAIDRACQKTVIVRTKRKPREYKDLWAWPVKELRQAIENRIEA